MRSSNPQKRKAPSKLRQAFTLVEILIVVVILGILAAIVVPQFTRATDDARAGNIVSQLQTLQNQIELYMARNGGDIPNFGSTASAAGWNDLVNGDYIKEAPSNPAHPTEANRTLVMIVDGTARGNAGAGWVFNEDDLTMYASFFNETTGVVSTTGTD